MMNEQQRAAMKLALKALKEVNSCGYATCWHGAFDTEVVALMAALEHREKQEPFPIGAHLGAGKDYTIKHSLDAALEQPRGEATLAPATELREQEPVGEMLFSEIIDGLIVPVVEKNLPVGTKLYTRPAKQPTEVIDPDSRTISVYEQPAQKDRIVELIHAWQAIEETSGHLRDENDVEGRMHMSVIRSAWEQMDALVREIWDERGRP